MAALKKTSILLALMFMVLAFTSTANAQLAQGTITCTAKSVNPLVRAEDVAAAAGNITLTCSNTTTGVETEQYLVVNLGVQINNTNVTNSVDLVGTTDTTTEAVVIINGEDVRNSVETSGPPEPLVYAARA